MQINKCNTAHKQNQGHEHHNRREKAFDKILQLALKKLGREGKSFSVKIGMRQVYSLSLLLLSIVLEFLARTIRQEKKIK
jgi:hypothetical protein